MEGSDFRVLVNHTKERRDYRESLSSWLLGEGVQITSSPPFDSYWGLHIHRDLPSAFDQFLPHHTVNSIPGCRRLFGDKDGLVRLQRTAKYELGVEGFAPPGYILPQDSVAFSARGSAGEVFARKRLCSHSGAGVEILSAGAIVRGMGNASSTSTAAQFVAQKYVLDVLLANGRYKFDVRWWAVITRTSPRLEAYLFADGYAKLACFGGAYDPHALTRCAHVTNAAVQRECAQRSRSTPRTGLCAEDQPRNVRSAEFQQAVAPVGTYRRLFEGAKRVLEQALAAAAWRLQLQRTKPACATFQLLAVDVLYTSREARPWLVEINLNGYLQSGVLKVPGAKERLVEMLRHVGLLPSQQCAPLHPDWVRLG